MQAEIIDSVLAGHDTLVLMPTGGGKSLCFQVPAILMRGTALVISPLISLMKDQVEALRQNGVAADYLNSSLSPIEQRQVEQNLYDGRTKLLYISPERLLAQESVLMLKRLSINLIAIDEAHCISSWGHDFRPEYTRLKWLRNTLPEVPIIALTATADKLTRKDIVEQLGLREPNVFISSFDRPNLWLEARQGTKRIEQIIDWIRARPEQSGIIYCLSRNATEQIANKLKAKGFQAEAYHAGLHDRVRSAVQSRFVRDELPIVCATIAFGMGIDKSNVRWVIHYNMPKNLEGFYQEIGRAGRDSAAADTLLFYSWNDRQSLADMIAEGSPSTADLQLAKLDRMYQYATTRHCRRRLLLTYFGEDYRDTCGHCDICRNPPKPFDGSIIAQKALSGVARSGQRIPQPLLVALLRGNNHQELRRLGLDELKTFGCGRDLSIADWNSYIEQLIHQGLLETAADARHALRLTPASLEVLSGERKVELVKQDRQKIAEKERIKDAPALAGKKFDGRTQDLFERLRKLRLRLGREMGMPPYMIASDNTLQEMSILQPTDSGTMRLVSGIGDFKLEKCGDYFSREIKDYTYEVG